MNDWKSVLRNVRRDMFGKTERSDQNRSVGSARGTTAPHSTSNQAHPKNHKRVVAATSTELLGSIKHKEKQPKRDSPEQLIVQKPASSTRSTQDQVSKPLSKPHEVALRAAKDVPNTLPSSSHGFLTRQCYFKNPEAWVAKGAATQAVATPNGTPADIVIGLDFGTSFTKAAISLRDQIFVVDWNGVAQCPDPFLLPSEFSIIDEQTCQLGQVPDILADQVRQRLKHPFIDAAVSSLSIANAAVFVALVLRYIRAWVFQNHPHKVGPRPLRWMLNIGAPSNGLENQRLSVAYRKLGSVAWELSLEDRITVSHAAEKLKTWSSESRTSELTDLQMVPEFVAQIAGYVQSPQRRPGLHALVDVGGGTLDVVTFIVHERDGENVFPFLVPEVRALGTHMLNHNRHVDAPPTEAPIFVDELQPVLSAEAYASRLGLPLSHVLGRDRLLWKTVHSVVQRVFQTTKSKRYRLSPAWQTGLPTFLTGGGAQVEGYQASVRSGGGTCSPSLTLISLPFHPKLAEFPGNIDQYQRVSVACGLAQDAYSLGQLIPAGSVEDDLPLARPIIDRPTSEDIYG